MSAKTKTITNPTIEALFRRKRPHASCQGPRPLTFSFVMAGKISLGWEPAISLIGNSLPGSLIFQANTRIDQYIKEVHGQIRYGNQEHINEGSAHDHGIIALANGNYVGSPHPRKRKHLLDDERTCDQRRQGRT